MSAAGLTKASAAAWRRITPRSFVTEICAPLLQHTVAGKGLLPGGQVDSAVSTILEQPQPFSGHRFKALLDNCKPSHAYAMSSLAFLCPCRTYTSNAGHQFCPIHVRSLRPRGCRHYPDMNVPPAFQEYVTALINCPSDLPEKEEERLLLNAALLSPEGAVTCILRADLWLRRTMKFRGTPYESEMRTKILEGIADEACGENGEPMMYTIKEDPYLNHSLKVKEERAKSGSKFIAGGEDMWVHVFDFVTGEEIACNNGHHGPVQCVRFAPGGESYASGSTIRIWQLSPANTDDEEAANANGKPKVGVEEVTCKIEGFHIPKEEKAEE